MLARYKENASHISPLLIIFSLFLLGLNIPKISIAVPLIIFPIILYTLSKKDLLLNKSDLIVNILLLAFSTSYYIILWMHEYIELVRGIRYILAIQVFYLSGHYSFFIFKKKNNDSNLLKPIIFLALGFSTFAITATIIKSIEISSFFIDTKDIRRVYVLWNVSEIYSTIIAVYCSLGIALLPVALKLTLLKNKIRYTYFSIVTIFLMTAAGIITSLMFSNRSTFIMIIYLALILLLYSLYLANKQNNLSWIKLTLIITLLFTAFYMFFITNLSFLEQYDIPLLKRFAKNNLGDTRSKLWWIGLQNLNTNFFGGKTYSLTLYSDNYYSSVRLAKTNINNSLALLSTNYYQLLYFKIFNLKTFGNVHNLWLDIHYVAGIFPFCFLIFFHIMHIKSFLLLIFQKKRKIIGITALCLGATILFYFMIEPIMKTAPRFFMASCFLLAYFRQISKSTSTTRGYFNS